MKKFCQEFKNELKEDKSIIWILIFAIYSFFSFEYFNKPFGDVKILKLPIDDNIPFIKELIIPYHTFMLMMILVSMILFTYDKRLFKRYIVVLFTSQTLAYIVFVNYQTYVPRYDTNNLGDDIFSKMIKMTYSVDNTYSGAPSLHVSNMTLSSIYVIKSKLKASKKIILVVYLSFVALTTVLVKQHVFLDIPTGLLHAIICYIIVELTMNFIERKKDDKIN